MTQSVFWKDHVDTAWDVGRKRTKLKQEGYWEAVEGTEVARARVVAQDTKEGGVGKASQG